MYHVVYSPEGQMFEVPAHKLEELVLQRNWTRTKPVFIAPDPEPEPVIEEKQTYRRKSRKKASDESRSFTFSDE